MEERAGNYRDYPNNFYLAETNIRKIHAVMEEYANKLEAGAYVSIYLARENDSFFETKDLEKIFNDENTSSLRIHTA